MADIDAWRNKVIRVIHAEPKAVAGPAGDTPLLRLSEELRRLTRIDRELVSEVLASLIRDPSADDLSSENYWGPISFLIYDLENAGPQRELREALHSRLFGKLSLDDAVKRFALRAYCVVGGRLYPNELEQLHAIRSSHPLDWLNAAVLSSEFDIATETAKRMLQQKQIDIGAFVLALDSWMEKWDRSVDFSRLTLEFRNCISADASSGRGKLDRWMTHRGIGIADLSANCGPAAKPGSDQPVQSSRRQVNSENYPTARRAPASSVADMKHWIGNTPSEYAITPHL